MRFYPVTFLVVLMVCSLSGNAQQSPWERSCPKAALQVDFNLMRRAVEQSHPALDLHHSRHLLEQQFDSLSALIHEAPISEAYSLFAEAVDHVEDGHTNLLLGEKETGYILDQEAFFPFTLKLIDGKAYVNHNFSEHDFLERGSELLSVNGTSINEIISQLEHFVTCDGRSRLAKLETLEGQFWWYYGLRFGYRRTFHIEFIEPQGGKVKALVASAVNYSDRFDMLSEVYGFEWEPSSDFYFSIDGDLAVITVNSFAGVSPWVYERFLNNCFRQINVQGINHLVLDIRKNGGGREGFDNVLLSHFNHTLEQKYDRIVAKTMSYSEYGQLERPKYSQFKDWMYRVFEFKPTEEGWTRKYDRFERKLKPSKYTFDGDVYVLISGQVFSAGSDFAAMAKEYIPNCLLIGSETLGGNQGNASGYYYRVVLPNTGFVLEVPRVLFELNINNPNKHGGVEPDIHVVTSIEDFLQGVDPHMSVVRDIVQEKLCLATDFTQ